MDKNLKINEKKSRPSFKRRLIQLYSALLFNAHIKGYITGDIFTGVTKNLCTPGLNCYSCPGAITSCPLGALQNAFASSDKRTPYYMFGIIMLYGLIFGRWICGWLCPFGLVQDLLHKIKTPKLKKGRVTHILSYFKYVILVLLVVILPLVYMLRDMPLPAFCKYVCPAGTLGGAIGLLMNPNNEGMFAMLGPLFTWKFALMVSFIVAAVFIYRVFCRFFCPLGALYGLFNRFALFGIKLEKKSCVDCGKCITVCKMDIREVGDHECINCGECISVCPTNAIQWRGSKIILPKNEIEDNVADEAIGLISTPENEMKASKRLTVHTGVIKIIAAVLMMTTLAGAIVYSNFVYDPNEIGDDTGTETKTNINIKELRGKIVVINFWGTWCGPCKSELPHFDEVASELEAEVAVLTVHSHQSRNEAPEYITDNYSNSKMIFAYDRLLNKDNPGIGDVYFKMLGGSKSYPMTLVLDENGVIVFKKEGSMTKAELLNAIGLARNSTYTDVEIGNKVGTLCPQIDLDLIITE